MNDNNLLSFNKKKLVDIYKNLGSFDIDKAKKEVQELKLIVLDIIKEIEEIDSISLMRVAENSDAKPNLILPCRSKEKFAISKSLSEKKEYFKENKQKYIRIFFIIIILVLIVVASTIAISR